MNANKYDFFLLHNFYISSHTWQHYVTDEQLMGPADLIELEAKIDDLIAFCNTLAEENAALRRQQNSWAAERAKLIAKNQGARQKVELMISRLKTLENNV